VHAGSSTMKLSTVEDGRLLRADTLVLGPAPPDDAIAARMEDHPAADAVGHRIVHGGTAFTAPVVMDPGVRRRLDELVDLAPLHLPSSLAAYDLAARLLPDLPHVACFDTAFHAGLDPCVSTYAIPVEWRRRWTLRRFGFHGLSHAWASRRAADMLGRSPLGFRVVTCHLGSGASAAAVADGSSVDTTMGFTPMEGLVMSTRSGSVDPGLVLWLQEHVGLPPGELAASLEHRSGLLGLAGTSDMAAVLAAEGGGDPDATLAVAVYLHRLRGAIAAMAAAMGGLDALAFTGGVGEHAPTLRWRAAQGLEFLGIALDDRSNSVAEPDADVSAPGAAVHTLVIASREDAQIAEEVTRLLERAPT